MNTQYIKSALVSGSMGSFLDAPNYPSHKYSVETDLNRKKENRGSMNIDYALTQDYISPALKERIQKLISEWDVVKPAIGTSIFNEWVEACVEHMGKGKALDHIRKFYPNYNQ